MENLCRLCLTFCEKDKLSRLSQKEYVRKIFKYFKVKLKVSKLLPHHICTECATQITGIESYCTKIKTNQEKLLLLLSSGADDLQNFYRSYFAEDIKEEKHNNKCESNTKSESQLTPEKVSDTSNENNLKDEIVGVSKLTETNPEYVKTESHSIADLDQDLDKDSDDGVEDFDAIEENIDNNDTQACDNTEEINGNIDNNLEYKAICQIDNFKCECSKVFDERKQLFNHFYDEHVTKNDKKKLLQCYDIKSGVFSCKECDKTFSSEVDMKVHLSDHEELYHPFVCNFCGRAFSTFSKIVRHGRAHFGLYLGCSKGCGYKTNYLGALREHEKRHEKAFKYTCETCGRGFMVRTWFEQHQNTHSGLKPFQCSYCSARFTMDKYLKQHIAKVHPHATDVKKYVCVQCGRVCDSKLSLKLHLEEHGVQPARTFLCEECGAAFRRGDHLRAHTHAHRGTRAHVCSVCNKAFLKKYTLKIHEKTHRNVKSFSCVQCSRSFSQNSSLKRHHQRKHSGSLFDCDRCGKGFKSSGRLERHSDRCSVKISDIDSSEVRMENRLNRKKKKIIGFNLVQPTTE